MYNFDNFFRFHCSSHSSLYGRPRSFSFVSLFRLFSSYQDPNSWLQFSMVCFNSLHSPYPHFFQIGPFTWWKFFYGRLTISLDCIVICSFFERCVLILQTQNDFFFLFCFWFSMMFPFSLRSSSKPISLSCFP